MIGVAVTYWIYHITVNKKSGWDRWDETTEHCIPRILFTESVELSFNEINIINDFLLNLAKLYFENHKNDKGLWQEEGYYYISELSQKLVELLDTNKYKVANEYSELHYSYCYSQKNKYIEEITSPSLYTKISKYHYIKPIHQNNNTVYIIRTVNGKYGLCNDNWQIILPCKFNIIWYASEKIHADGNVLLDLNIDLDRIALLEKYDWVDFDKNNIIYTRINDKLGLIFPNGFNTGCVYDKIEIKDGVIFVNKGNKKGTLSLSGEIIIPAIYSEIEINSTLLKRPIYKVISNDKKGILDINGTTIVPCKYENIMSCNSTHCVIACTTQQGYVLYRNGRQISRAYQMINDFYNGVAAVNMGGCWKTGHKQRYFSGGKWGLIDENGKVIILCNIYRKLYFIGSGRYIAMFYDIHNNKHYQIVNEKGELGDFVKFDINVNSIEYSGINGTFIVVSNHKYGLYSLNGSAIIECKYDKIDSFGVSIDYLIDADWDLIDADWDSIPHIARVKLNGKYGYIDGAGKIIVPIKYSYLDTSYEKQCQNWDAENAYYDYQKEMEESSFYALSDGQLGDYKDGIDWDAFSDSLGR